MDFSKFVRALIICIGLGTLPANGQFYAPDTEHHDQVQRTFVVELARVLAWRENLSDPKIAEVTFQVTNGAEHQTTWNLQWLGDDGRQIRQATVSYSSSLLLDGPEFYRNVFRQLWAPGWKPLAAQSGANVSDYFWREGENCGVSRLDGLDAAFKLAPAKPTLSESEYAPRLAGLLTHTCLPSTAGSITLDTVVLARAAAWLCLSENMIREAGGTNDALWAPILFLAGREPAANELWKQAVKVPPAPGNAPMLFTWWDFLLRRPARRDVYLFAAMRGHRELAAPMLAYYSRLFDAGPLFARLLPEYYPGRELVGLYDYASYLDLHTGVSGGRILEGAFAMYARQHWLGTLYECPAGPFDYTNHVAAVKAALVALRSTAQDTNKVIDPSLRDLSLVAPVIKLGLEEGRGKLTPTATVTTRDLLNYGWETTGMQMGGRYIFLQRFLADVVGARPVYEETTRLVPGLVAFFPNSNQKHAYDLDQMLYRFQNVEFLMSKLDATMQPFAKDPRDRDAARTYVRRIWLRPGDLRGQCWTLREAGIQGDIAPLLRTSHTQAGLLSDAYALDYLDTTLKPGVATTPRLFAIQEEFARNFPEPSPVQVDALYAKDYAPMTNFDRARALEKVYWQNQESGVESRVFDNYVMAGAYTSARRFYIRARGNIYDPVGFGNSLAHECFILAWLRDDRDLMKMALQDGSTGSGLNFEDLIYACAIREEYGTMDRLAIGLAQRYEPESGSNSIGRRLHGFIPLIPALKDPASTNRIQALDYWGKDGTMSILRWILARKYNLSPDETARFLGGEESDPFRRVLILYARGDKAGIRAAWNDFMDAKPVDRAAIALASYLTNDLAPDAGQRDESDLMPPGATFIADAVKAELAK